jgi:hypothetical protein
MKKVLLLLLALSMVPAVVAAQTPEDCPNCVIGIYDTTDLDANYGLFDAPTKELHIGVIMDAAVATGLSGVEFSIYGLEEFFFSFDPAPGSTVDLGTIPTPTDPLTGEIDPDGTGGKNIAWPNCQESVNGKLVIGKLTLVPLAPVGDDVVLWVERSYPPSNPNVPYPLFNQCDFPQFTTTSVTAGCYVFNPTVGPGGVVDGCTLGGTAVEDKDWSTIKSLYR